MGPSHHGRTQPPDDAARDTHRARSHGQQPFDHAQPHRFDDLLATGQVKDQAEIARTAGITRARVTQILNLTQLAPDIQQAILALDAMTDSSPKFRESEIRQIAIEHNWIKQRKGWKRLSNRPNPSETKS